MGLLSSSHEPTHSHRASPNRVCAPSTPSRRKSISTNLNSRLATPSQSKAISRTPQPAESPSSSRGISQGTSTGKNLADLAVEEEQLRVAYLDINTLRTYRGTRRPTVRSVQPGRRNPLAVHDGQCRRTQGQEPADITVRPMRAAWPVIRFDRASFRLSIFPF